MSEEKRGRGRPKAAHDPQYVADICEAVYKKLLGPGGAERMLEKDADGGKKLRGRSLAYRHIVIAVLEELEGK